MEDFLRITTAVFLLHLAISLCNGKQLQFILLSDAPQTNGARCLDGSPPGFYFRPAFGSGRGKWIIHLEGGGSCATEDSCLARSFTNLGSTVNRPPSISFRRGGLFSDLKSLNPDFYNWNVVFVAYCDGFLYSTDVKDPFVTTSGVPLYFRGFRILEAVVSALLNLGMKRASDVILTGCSSGGTASLVQADYVHSLLPIGVKYGVLADAAFFLPATELSGLINVTVTDTSTPVFTIFNFGGVDEDCIRDLAPAGGLNTLRCISFDVLAPYITSPLFILNSYHDSAIVRLSQLLGIDFPLNTLRERFLNSTINYTARDDVGAYFDSCIRHCQLLDDTYYGVTVEGQTLRETFANWYFERSGKSTVMDCEEHPCNDSCGRPRNDFGVEFEYEPYSERNC